MDKNWWIEWKAATCQIFMAHTSLKELRKQEKSCGIEIFNSSHAPRPSGKLPSNFPGTIKLDHARFRLN
jgi:hypothetical protein